MIKRRGTIQLCDPELEVQGSDSVFHTYNERNFRVGLITPNHGPNN